MSFWQLITAMIATVSALVGAPLGAILFYLRAIREDQHARQAAVDQRLGALESDLRQLQHAVDDLERNYTTKEEWIRETMLARQQLERLSELMARIQAELEQSRGLATQFLRATNAIIELAERLAANVAAQARVSPVDVDRQVDR